MNARMHKVEAALVLLGLGLAVVVNAGCATQDKAGPAITDRGCEAKEALKPDEKAALEEVRAAGLQAMTAGELKKALASEQPPVVVDVLSAASYAECHIEGSISLPSDRVRASAAERLPDRSARVVVYCASFHCRASTAAALALKELGYTNVCDFKGGLKQWRELGWPVEGTGAGK